MKTTLDTLKNWIERSKNWITGTPTPKDTCPTFYFIFKNGGEFDIEIVNAEDELEAREILRTRTQRQRIPKNTLIIRKNAN